MQTTSRGKCVSIDRSINGGVGCGRESEAAKRKSPLRVEGEWSEYISSKGLIYYYHCRTEVSQWQRPHEWTLPSMTHDEIKRKMACKIKNNASNNVKRNCPIMISQNLTSSPKRIKFNNQQKSEDRRIQNNFNPKIIKNDVTKTSKVNVQVCNNVYTNNIKNKNAEANFNNDDMDISPNSSPMSRGSHSDECEKKIAQFNFDSNKGQLHVISNKNYDKIINENVCKINSSPGIVESGSCNNLSIAYKFIDNGTTTNLSQFQMSLISTLRNVLSVLQSRSTDNKHESCLLVTHISELLTKFETVLNMGGTMNSYRSHRLQTQLHNSSNTYCQNPKAMIKLSANIYQIKELIKYIQGFIQENYPHSVTLFTPVSPNYSKSLKTQYYMQVLHNLVETCILQLDPQSLTSPCSTSSPGSSKDTNSIISFSTTNSHDDQNNKSISPTTKEQSELLQNKSILFDPEMLKFVSTDISNTYKNQLADCYIQEAQIEYYKFVRLHSIVYPELTCESKKLKALVRISEINTELFKHKKDDLERLVHMLDLRRLPNHLKCDYLPPPVNN